MSSVAAEMSEADFAWAARLMQQRRERYAAYSPVFWRPAPGVLELHTAFLRHNGTRAGAVALRTRHGFVISLPSQGRCFVDDFAVEDDALWVSEGRDLLLAAWRRARCPEQDALRVVSARRDEPKRQMLMDLGLTPKVRWWVKELTPSAPVHAGGPITVAGVPALLVAAPPVYAPGGPVCLLGDLDSQHAATAAEHAAARGAVLAIVQREGGDSPAAATDPELESAGYHNPAEFYEGRP